MMFSIFSILISSIPTHEHRMSFHLLSSLISLLFFFLKINLFIYLGCVGSSSLLCTGFPSSCGEWGATLRCGAQASHCGGFSRCRAWALGVRASVAVACGL